MPRRALIFLITAVAAIFPAAAFAEQSQASWQADFGGHIELQQRIFVNDNYSEQERAYSSAAANPKLRIDYFDTTVLLNIFARHDFTDDSRTHEDVREAIWQHIGDTSEWRAGIGQVFWGVVESRHLVDIINQADWLERFDGDAKLGQPMLNWTRHGTNSNLDLFVLPYFRERIFPGPGGRLRSPLPMASAHYESGAEEQHIDAALRWQYMGSGADISLSYFNGTAREPIYNFVFRNGLTMIEPDYFLLSQWGLEAQKSIGNFLLKGEAIHRESDQSSWASVTGFEYTIENLGNGDIGLVLEHLFDSRETTPAETFDDDVFFGVRFSSNALSSTHALAGIYQDRRHSGRIFKLEANTRIAERFTLTLELWRFDQLPPEDITAFFNRDDYAELGLRYFFD